MAGQGIALSVSLMTILQLAGAFIRLSFALSLCQDSPEDPIAVGNLVTNPDFTNAIFPWVPSFGSPSLSRGGVGSGNPYLMMHNRGKPSNGPFLPVSFIEPNVIFQLTAWVRVGSAIGTEPLSAMLKATGEGNVESHTVIGTVTASSSCWTILTGNFSHPTSPTGQTGIYFESPNATTDIFVDSVSVLRTGAVAPVPSPPPAVPPPSPTGLCETSPGNPISADNLITNPDFTTAILPWVPFFGTPSLSRGGTGSANPYLLMENRNNPSNGPFYPVSFIEPNVIFQLTAWVRVGSANTVANLSATLKATDAGNIESYTTIGTVKASPSCWTLLTGTFSRTATPTGQTGIYFESPNSIPDVWIDSVSVVRTVSAASAPSPPPLVPPPASPITPTAPAPSPLPAVQPNVSSPTPAVPAAPVPSPLPAVQSNASSPTDAVSVAPTPSSLPAVQPPAPSITPAVPAAPAPSPLPAVQPNASSPTPAVSAAPAPSPLPDVQPPASSITPTGICQTSPDNPIATNNLVTNPDFTIAVLPWIPLFGSPSLSRGGTGSGNPYLIMENRGNPSNGPFLPILFIEPNVLFLLTAWVRVGSANAAAPLSATLKATDAGNVESYTAIATVKASPACWTLLTGNFSRTSFPTGQTGIYFESPNATTDVWVDSVSVVRAVPGPPAPSPPPAMPPPAPPTPPPGTFYVGDPYKCAPVPGPIPVEMLSTALNMVYNPGFMRGLQGWEPFGTTNLTIRTIPGNTNPFIVASGRKQAFAGPSQRIPVETVKLNKDYALSVWVKVDKVDYQFVKVTLKVEGDPRGSQYLCFANGIARSGCWTFLQGALRLPFKPTAMTLYFEGPDPEVDLWVDSISMYGIDPVTEKKEQDASIDKIRKRDVVLKIRGADGKPVDGAVVKVEQTDSAFPWGAAISYNITYDKKYEKYYLGRKFNMAVFENELKWATMQPTADCIINYTAPDKMLAWAKKNNLKVRGHSIFWEDERYNADWVRKLSAQKLRAAVEDRLKTLLRRYKGQFVHYDVDNEITTYNFFPSRLPNDNIQKFFFQRAHQLDPKAVLFMNEYGTTEACGNPKQNTDHYLNTVLKLKAAGVPIMALGVEAHFGYGIPIPFFIKANVNKLATAGLPIWVTEMDFDFTDENAKAEYMETALRSYFSNPNIHGIILWQTSDRCASRCITNRDYSPKPASVRYDKMRALWTTKLSTITTKQGKASFRGFFGKYKITVSRPYMKTFVFDNVNVPPCPASSPPIELTLTCKKR